jgi:threonine synthase
MPKFRLKCVRCGSVQEQPYNPRCSQCDGLTEPLYNLAKAKLYDSDDPYTRFFDLIPVTNRSLLPATTAYTPTVHAEKLGAKLGMPSLYLKNETVHPTRTTKYRMAAIALAYLYESGVRHFCTSSTGNSSTAYASHIANLPEMKMSLFTAAEFQDRVNYHPSKQIDHHVLEGYSFAEAFNYAAEFAGEHGYTAERGFFNPGRREGLKLAWCEATDQVEQPIDWYVQAVSSGMGVYGTYKAAGELLQMNHIDRLPHLLCAQQESCAPMVNAWEEGAEKIAERHIVHKPHGIAKAILRGDPRGVYPYMREIVQHSQGEFTAVSESQIREARTLVGDMEGIGICFSAATAVAGLIKMRRKGRVPAHHTVLINLTGNEREKGAIV